jgi:hypothetical protein
MDIPLGCNTGDNCEIKSTPIVGEWVINHLKCIVVASDLTTFYETVVSPLVTTARALVIEIPHEDGDLQGVQVWLNQGITCEECDWAIQTMMLELYAFLLATKKWRSYLYGRKFVWFTDHKPLLLDEHNPSKKVGTWLDELKELDFEAIYIKGDDNKVADPLSRYAHIPEAPSTRLMALTQRPKPERIAVKRTEVPLILTRFHDDQGHKGVKATLGAIKRAFYRPGMTGDIVRWCSTCDLCQKMRTT